MDRDILSRSWFANSRGESSVVTGSSFRRVEGSGGDGGVEGYWLLPGGSKYGYQAKYFTRARDIKWAQIAVYEALKNHPTLTRYVIAIPCDLTDRSGATGRGRTGWQHWEAHKRKWLARYRRRRPGIDFLVWTAFELRDLLISTSAEGLRRYWFGHEEFSSAWFARHLSAAIAALDERYHPEDHVNVATERLFEFVCRNQAAVRSLKESVAEIIGAPIPDSYLKQIDDKLPLAELTAISRAVDAVTSIEPEFGTPPWQNWDLNRWTDRISELKGAVEKLRSWTWQERSRIGEDSSDARNKLDYLSHSLSKLSQAVDSLEALLRSRYMQAEQARAALIEGRAGTGKSHLLGKIAQRALQEERPVVLLLGQQFTDLPIWSQISKRLGWGAIDPESFLQALDAASEAAHKRGLILIDAINEGAGAKIWKDEIAPFLAQVRRHPNLACFVSCRSEYVRYAIPNGVLSSIPRFEIKGFETQQEQIQAAKVYMDKRGISRPGVPWLAPEFV